MATYKNGRPTAEVPKDAAARRILGSYIDATLADNFPHVVGMFSKGDLFQRVEYIKQLH